MRSRLVNHILASESLVAALQRSLTALPAMGPENGGQGEAAKARFIAAWLEEEGINQCAVYEAPDARVESGARPNLVVSIPGQTPRNLCLFGHLDVVPPGNPDLWHSNPWRAEIRGDFIYGRGVEDNQQAIVSMLVLAKSLKELNIVPRLGLKLFFLADEECGSRNGLIWLADNHPELFSPQDLYIVPDGGSADGSEIEIAEKAQLWLKFTVNGRQCHASAPQNGINAFVAACALVLRLNGLNEIFNARNPLFSPPRSTFVPTRHDANVPSVNILPGADVFFMDCRLLPQEPLEKAMSEIRAICAEVENERNVKIALEVVQSREATAISADCPAIPPLFAAIKAIYDVEPRLVGIGGATVAAILRKRGLDALVWSKILNTCHQPNEHSSLSAACGDAAVFASMVE